MLVLYGFLRMVPSPYSEKHILSWNVSKVNPKLPLGSGFLPPCPVDTVLGVKWWVHSVDQTVGRVLGRHRLGAGVCA